MVEKYRQIENSEKYNIDIFESIRTDKQVAILNGILQTFRVHVDPFEDRPLCFWKKIPIPSLPIELQIVDMSPKTDFRVYFAKCGFLQEQNLQA